MNNANAWFQFALYLAALLLITKPLGLHLVRVLDADGRTFLDRLVKPIERATYRLIGVDPAKEQSWSAYTFALLS
ncbi:MAG TPA: potassium-transporting ATPase subunit KdpA, partial [Luteolibacter sp.]